MQVNEVCLLCLYAYSKLICPKVEKREKYKKEKAWFF